MIRKVLFMFSLLMVVSYSSLAETVKWLVRPEYDAIGYFNENLFKCKKEGKYRLIDMEGKSVVTDFDSITDFHEGIALVLDKHDNGYGIRGFFFEKGNRFDPIDGNYFAGQYSFFSEGLLSVIDASNYKCGYLDTSGHVIIPCKYRQARPFSHGWASVEPSRKRKRTQYINTKQETLRIKGFHHGVVIMGSSFNADRRALVSYYDNDNAVIKIVEKDGKYVGEIDPTYKRNYENSPVRSCDFAFNPNGRSCVKEKNKRPTFDSSITTFSLGNRFGYKLGERVIAPAQFAYAGGFANRCAIVSIDGSKYGILLLADGEFGGNLNGENVIVKVKDKKDKKEKYKELTYSFIIPNSMEGLKYQIEFDKGEGVFQPIVLQNNAYTFIPSVDENREYCLMRTRVIAEDLMLWADSIERGIGNIFIKEIKACSDQANENDEFRVTATVYNGSNVDIDVKVTFVFGSQDEKNIEKNNEGKKTQEDKKKGMKNNGITKTGIPRRSRRIMSNNDETFTSMIKVEHIETIPVTSIVRVGDEVVSRKTDTITLKPF